MRTILRIDHIEEKTNAKGDIYHRTHATLEDGEECVGFGKDFKVGDLVMVFYDDKWGLCKMMKKKSVDK